MFKFKLGAEFCPLFTLMYLWSDYLLRVFIFCQALLILLQRDARSLRIQYAYFIYCSIFYFRGFIKFKPDDCKRVKEKCICVVTINWVNLRFGWYFVMTKCKLSLTTAFDVNLGLTVNQVCNPRQTESQIDTSIEIWTYT